MKRRNFLKRLLGGVAAAVVAPRVVEAIKPLANLGDEALVRIPDKQDPENSFLIPARDVHEWMSMPRYEFRDGAYHRIGTPDFPTNPDWK